MAHLKTTYHHIRRSPYQAIAAILIMTLTFFVVSAFTFLLVGSSQVINFFESKPQVTAFFKNEAKQTDIDDLKKQLVDSAKIASMKFVSKKDAFNIYKEQNKNDPLLLDLVSADILPASLEVATFRIEDLPQTAETLAKSPSVYKVAFQRDVVATLTTWTNALRKIGVVLIVALGTVSIFIMTTIVSIKVSQKREEIEIMRLLGASKWYVSLPFVFEGVAYGLVGALFGWLFASGALMYSTPFLSTFLRGIPVLPVSMIFLGQLLGVEFLLAALLGMFASWIAVMRYLK